MTIQWIDKMAVDVEGEGETVVMLHGLGGSMNVWAPLMPALQNYRVIRIDMPGSGRSKDADILSKEAANKGELSADLLAQCVIKVCKALNVQKAHLVGHSWGTLISQYVTVKAPQLVKSLCLFGVLPQPYPAMREGMQGRASDVRANGMFGSASVISDVALSASTKETQPITVAYVHEGVASQDPEGFARNCLALAAAKPTQLEEIACPVMLITGDEDIVTPLSSARELMARVPQARLEILSKCGHWPTLERTEASRRILRDFLDRQR
ncbi:alpha/beta hydrolase [Variovorax sp. PCZ-1]|uniref:alpha/beta fold hydrolase n=1 Tax=Variovorax sp. PCZ-1 TaxID=2835533 RepID=UPI001BD1AB67|nr:alpha/beta hydrolase [Variovorax sp. PCZ-1]MBS7806024.1 alpha/beta fold hydrolase [Variovorax sp. PCZ-1]